MSHLQTQYGFVLSRFDLLHDPGWDLNIFCKNHIPAYFERRNKKNSVCCHELNGCGILEQECPMLDCMHTRSKRLHNPIGAVRMRSHSPTKFSGFVHQCLDLVFVEK